MRRPRFRSLLPGNRNASTAEPAQEGIGTKLRQILLGITVRGGMQSQARDLRKLLVTAAHIARQPGGMRAAVEDMVKIERAQIEEASTWLTAEQIKAGEQGRFDACDLRNWLVIAERAGVPAIPAINILTLTPAEYNAACGSIEIPTESPRIARALNKVRASVNSDYTEQEIADFTKAEPSNETIDRAELGERLASAMDQVPEGWMVRSHVCGGDNLKTLGGCGGTQLSLPQVRLGPHLEIGPGWYRVGNRRVVDTKDRRTMELYVRNDTVPIAYLARPWVVASRWMKGRDPHRAGTPLDMPGEWPAEWRVFVRDGKVVGVSAYYPWAGTVDAISARMAIKAGELGQRIVDQAIADGLMPRAMDNVLARLNPTFDRALNSQGMYENSFDCTLDFIESNEHGAIDGLLLLEAGPGCGMLGGGHPCGFAGDMVEAEFEGQPMNYMPCVGVALRHMDHVLVGEPESWKPGNKEGAILSWEEAQALANTAGR